MSSSHKEPRFRNPSKDLRKAFTIDLILNSLIEWNHLPGENVNVIKITAEIICVTARETFSIV